MVPWVNSKVLPCHGQVTQPLLVPPPAALRVGRGKWFNLLWLVPIGSATLLIAVAIAQRLRNMPAVQRFMVRYPGVLVCPDR